MAARGLVKQPGRPHVQQPSSGMSLLLLPPALLSNIFLELMQEDDIRVLPTLLCTCKALAAAACAAASHLDALSTSRTNASALAKQRGPGSTSILPRLLLNLPGLRHLDLTNAHGLVDDRALAAIGACCKHLTALTLRSCQQITPAGLQDMAEAGLPHLQSLSLDHCGDVDGSFLCLLPRLERFSANYCRTLTPAAICQVAERLTALSVQSCELIDDSICEGLRVVQHLNIARTGVGDQGLLLLQQCMTLQRLVVAERSNNIWTDCAWSESALRRFTAARPDVIIEQTWAL